MPVNPLIWGKSLQLARPQPLVCHLLDTAAIAELVWDRMLSPAQRRIVVAAIGVPDPEARALVAFWAGLHDLAKVTVPFQLQKDSKKAYVRPELLQDPALGTNRPAACEKLLGHETAALWTLPQLFADIGYPTHPEEPSPSFGHVVAQYLAGHGGHFPVALTARQFRYARRYRPELGGDAWAAERRAHFDEVRRVLGATAVPQGTMTAEAAVILTGLTMLSDQLASEERHLKNRLVPGSWAGRTSDITAYWPVARAAAEELLEWSEIPGTSFAEPAAPPSTPWRQLGEQLPALIAEHGPGLTVVAGAPGKARTDAALHAASLLGHAAGSQGIFYALPSGTVADGRLDAVHAFAEHSLRGPRASLLLHSASSLLPWEATEQVARIEPEFGPEERWAPEATSWLADRKRSLLVALGTGTVDELLQAVLPLPHNAMRLFALSRKVIVVDEAHARGPWGHRLMTRFLEWMGALGTPVVVATSVPGKALDALPEAYRRGAAGSGEPTDISVPLPGWAYVSGDFSTTSSHGESAEYTLDIDVRPGSEDAETAAALRPLVASGAGSVIVFRPTPESAVATFRHLAEAIPALRDEDLLLVHEQLPNRARWQRIADARRRLAPHAARPAPTVLVTTPVLEHVPELATDLVVSGPAPLGPLLARVPQPPDGARSRLLLLADGEAADTDDKGLTRRTKHVLGAGRSVSIPGDLRSLYDEVYAEDFGDGLEAAAAREMRTLDNHRTAHEANARGTASWAAIPGPRGVGSDLNLLTNGPTGMSKGLLGPGLGEDLVQVVCLFRVDVNNSQAFFFDPYLTEKAKPPRNGKPRWDPLGVLPHVTAMPRRYADGVNCRVNHKWENTGSLQHIVPIVMKAVDGRGVYESPLYRFEFGPHGLLVQPRDRAATESGR